MPPIELKKLAPPPAFEPQPPTPNDVNQLPPGVPSLAREQIDVKKIRETCKLFVATPMYGGSCNGLYVKSAINLQIMMAQLGIECRFSFLFNESLIPRARNYLVDEFLRSGYTHLLFLDSDIEFQQKDVLALLHLDKDVIGGPYPKKSIKWQNVKSAILKNPNVAVEDLEKLIGDYVFNPVPGTKNFNVFEPVEVLEIGTGFMMVKREVFQKYAEHYPEFEYTPDHQGQKNFDGSRKIHAFFHCDIDPVSNRYLSEDYWFCTTSNCRVDTEHGVQTIGNIVRNKYSGKVKTLLSDGSFGFRNVTGWSRRKNKTNKQWVKINTENSNNRFSKLTCTDDHQIAVFDDPMVPENISYVEAKDSVGKYSVRGTQKNENSLYDKTGLSVLLGTLFGDAHINKAGQVSITHSLKQHDYHEYKNLLLGGKKIFVTKKTKKAFTSDALTEMSCYPVNAQTKYLRNLMYIDGIKTIKNVIEYIDEISLAFWYMDDGSINKNYASLATYGFSYEDNLLLKDMFKDRWDIDCVIDRKTVTYKDENKNYFGLRLSREGSKKFFELIERYIHPSMQYKLPEEMRHEYNVLSPSSEKSLTLDYSGSKIVGIVPVKLQSMLYDIEVDETHNFVAQNTVIHNCQMWRNMGGTIYYCPWMTTKHVGTYAFTGDLPAIAKLSGQL